MPVYNEERYLEQALQSLLSQSFGNFELIFSDNASTDRTCEICLTYAAKDPRVPYSRMETNLGSSVNFNKEPPMKHDPAPENLRAHANTLPNWMNGRAKQCGF
jgi:glycosyltransferase involved in cell wall biosynthesis